MRGLTSASDLSPARSGTPDSLVPLPTTVTSAKHGDCDAHAFHQFFLQCIHGRYSPSDQGLNGVSPMRKDDLSHTMSHSSWWGGASHAQQGSHSSWAASAPSHPAVSDFDAAAQHQAFPSAVQGNIHRGQASAVWPRVDQAEQERQDRERASLFGGRAGNVGRLPGGAGLPALPKQSMRSHNAGFAGFQQGRIDDD